MADRSAPTRLTGWIAAMVVALPVFYVGAYLCVRASHLLIHHTAITGPYHRIDPGGDCAARSILCLGPEPCSASERVIPALFRPLIVAELVMLEIGDYLG